MFVVEMPELMLMNRYRNLGLIGCDVMISVSDVVVEVVKRV
jgi:hypothetical protein